LLIKNSYLIYSLLKKLREFYNILNMTAKRNKKNMTAKKIKNFKWDTKTI